MVIECYTKNIVNHKQIVFIFKIYCFQKKIKSLETFYFFFDETQNSIIHNIIEIWKKVRSLN